MTTHPFDASIVEANRISGEAMAARVMLDVGAGEEPQDAIDRQMRLIAQENDHYFSAIGSVLLTTMADFDTGLDRVAEIIDDPEETWVVDEDRPPVRLALAAAYLRRGDLERAQTTFFEAAASSQRNFRPSDLPRVNGFIAEWTRYKLRELTTPAGGDSQG